MSAQHYGLPHRAAPDATTPLRDAVQRALRGRHYGWAVISLHLSRLAPPAPRPHHRRIARAVLSDAASRYQGQLFTLINGDMALLFLPNDHGIGLAATLGTLFSADAPDPGLLLSRWSLPDHQTELSAFLDALPTIAAAPGDSEQDSGFAAVTTLFDAIDLRRIRELMDRQTGVLVTTGGTGRVIPLFREIRFSIRALEAKAAESGYITADPFLFRHLTAKLDSAMLSAAVADLDYDRPMLAGARGGLMAFHINMSVDAVLSPSFDLLVESVGRAEARVAVEISLLEAVADTENFRRACDRVRAAGFQVVLDDVTHHALLVLRASEFGCDWLKLDWSRLILQAGEMLDVAVQAAGAARIILQSAETEDAVRWGLARGIRRFQGRHADAILAAGRLAVCPASGACTLRNCIEREREVTPAGRIGCQNHALLDAGAELPL